MSNTNIMKRIRHEINENHRKNNKPKGIYLGYEEYTEFKDSKEYFEVVHIDNRSGLEKFHGLTIYPVRVEEHLHVG